MCCIQAKQVDHTKICLADQEMVPAYASLFEGQVPYSKLAGHRLDAAKLYSY